MDPVASGCQSYISARVNQELRSEFAVLSFQLAQNANGFASQCFEVSRAQIFFAELDEVDLCASGFSDLLQKANAASRFASWKRAAVGDVVEKQAHPPW